MKIEKFLGFTKFPFHVFDRYEINIQNFVDFINGKYIIFRASSSQDIYYENLGHSLANKAINWPIKAINNRAGNPEIMEDQDVDV